MIIEQTRGQSRRERMKNEDEVNSAAYLLVILLATMKWQQSGNKQCYAMK